MALSWLCFSAFALREFNPLVDKPLTSGTIGDVFVLPRKANASGGAASLASTISKVAAAFPEFDYVWVDTDEHKDWVEQELDVPEEYLPLILARLRESPEDRFWYEEFPFTRGIKEGGWSGHQGGKQHASEGIDVSGAEGAFRKSEGRRGIHFRGR